MVLRLDRSKVTLLPKQICAAGILVHDKGTYACKVFSSRSSGAQK